MRGIRLVNKLNKEFNINLVCCCQRFGSAIYYSSYEDPISIRLICQSNIYNLTIFTKNSVLINKGSFKIRDKFRNIKIKQLIHEALSYNK